MSHKNSLALIDQGFCNARLKLYLGKNGELLPDSFMCCERECFNPLHLPMVHNQPTGKAQQKLYEQIEHEAELFIDEALAFAGKSREYFAGVDMLTPAKKRVEAECLRKAQATKAETNKARSRRRARTKCRDYVLGNYDLDMMVTLTINNDCVDRYDYTAIVKNLSQWLSNRVKRNGLKYVLVPELHEDGAIHFHGFVNSNAVKLTKTKYKRGTNGKNFIYALEPTRKGRLIYNISDWEIGYTTAVRIGKSEADRNAVATYILKYLSKQTEKIGGRWYLHSNNLNLPYEIYMCYNYLEVPCEPVTPVQGINIKVITNRNNSTFLGKLNLHDIYDLGISTKDSLCANTSAHGL